MPLLKLDTTVAMSDDQRTKLLTALSQIVVQTIGKPEQYVMVTIAPAAVRMAGQAGDAAFADIRNIGGLSPDVNRQLAQKVCQLLHQSLGIAPERVYLNFTEVKATHWGWNGATFG